MDETTLRFIAQQLRQPSGEPGRGRKMNVGNEHVNRAAIAALRVAPQDQILEVGMGNGTFVPLILSVNSSVRYAGCDFLETMVEEAIRRNEAAVERGQAQFFVASAESLPFVDGSFDKLFTLNTVFFGIIPLWCWRNFGVCSDPAGDGTAALRAVRFHAVLGSGIERFAEQQRVFGSQNTRKRRASPDDWWRGSADGNTSGGWDDCPVNPQMHQLR